jgi:hypothetical protein
MTAIAASGAVVYLALSRLLRIGEVNSIVRLVSTRLGR